MIVSRQWSVQMINLSKIQTNLSRKLLNDLIQGLKSSAIFTCLVIRVCTEDRSRPMSSELAIPSLSPETNTLMIHEQSTSIIKDV